MENFDYLDENYSSHKVDNLEEENIENLSASIQDNSRKLLFEPDSLEGVASAYRYKLTILNPELEGCAFNFTDDLDVFNFNDVNKKRALKKEEWPTDSPLDNPKRYDVQVHLMAGNAEIKSCGGCSMWKDLTRKPFLMLTPHGNRCVQFVKRPFILMIFRCCPKFHSYAKQFKLVINITSPTTGLKYSSEISIYRKKMNNTNKKRKVDSSVKQEENDEEEESPSKNQKSKDKFDATLILHETLFPQQAALLKPQKHLETPMTSSLLSNCFPSTSQSEAKKSPLKHGAVHRIPQYQLPFQHLQHEMEMAQQHFVNGQPQPHSSYSPQMLYDLLYRNHKPTTTTTYGTNPIQSPPVYLPETQSQVTKKSSFGQFSLFDPLPEPSNDETWIESFLNSTSFETSKEGFERYTVEDAISFNPNVQLGF